MELTMPRGLTYAEPVPQPLTAGDVHQALMPMFTTMLTDDELATLNYRVVRVDACRDEPPLRYDVDLDDVMSWIRWEIANEEGGSGSLHIEDGLDVLVRRVQSDLQDFIAESRFAWGQYRGPHHLLS